MKTYLIDKWRDFKFWYDDKPFSKFYRSIKDRFDAVIFCLLLLAVGIYSPRALRRIMIDSLRDTK
jgi:hypothetical protein